MSQCPVCQAPVTADFGLVECDKCQAQLIVHMDGTVEHSQGGGAPADPFAETDPGIVSEVSPPLDLGDILGDEIAEASVPAMEDSPEAQDQEEPFSQETRLATNSSSGAQNEFQEAEPAFEPAPEEPTPEEPAPEEHAPEDSAPPSDPPADYDPFAEENDGGAAPEAYSLAPKASDSADLSDIAQFGNSENSGGRDGTLRYILHISGIDTSDVRMAFREALTDRKFLWDIDQILRGLKNGNVRIENVSATKAHVLISRLRNMPVKVRWEQYAVHQS